MQLTPYAMNSRTVNNVERSGRGLIWGIMQKYACSDSEESHEN
jgi:hypothetical protein